MTRFGLPSRSWLARSVGALGVPVLVAAGWFAGRYFDTERPLSQAALEKTRAETKEVQQRLAGTTAADAAVHVQVTPGLKRRFGLVMDVAVTNLGTNTFAINPNGALTIGRLVPHATGEGMDVVQLQAVPFRAVGMHEGRPQLMRTTSEIMVTPGRASFSYYTEVAQEGVYIVMFAASLPPKTLTAIQTGVTRVPKPGEIARFGDQKIVSVNAATLSDGRPDEGTTGSVNEQLAIAPNGTP